MESKSDIDILARIKRRGEVELINLLSTPVKNKLISVSDYAVQHDIGNKELSMNILNNLSLEDIYLNVKQRRNLALNLSKSLNAIKKTEEGKQCKDVLSKYITFKKTLGSGSFGEVSLGSLIHKVSNTNVYNRFDFAVKMARQLKIAISPEYHIANLMNRLVLDNRAQNLPIMMDSYTCDRCSFGAKTITTKSAKCIFSVSEIATGGDMVEWLSSNPSEESLDSALFQIMAGIHALQHYYSIVNTDIKAQNILIYNVNPGGYWKYTIYGLDFYVPNVGKLFIVNDFGIAKIYSPQFKYTHELKKNDLMTLGDRTFLINNNRFDALKNPFVKAAKIQKYDSTVVRWDDGSAININRVLFNPPKNKIIYNPILTKEQKDLIGFDSTDLRFYDSRLAPPLEFMVDTQDVLRLFISGKRMYQTSEHVRYKLNQQFINRVKRYNLNSGANTSYHTFLMTNVVQSTDLSKMLPGYFLIDYFTKQVNYTVPKSKDQIISHIRTS
jgi:hypothetical protein